MRSCSPKAGLSPDFAVYLVDAHATRMQYVEAVCFASDLPLKCCAWTGSNATLASFGLVGLTDGSATPAEWEIIRQLQTSGVKFIVYADGAASLPVAERYEFLLAGCADVLDSAAQDFAFQLRKQLQQFALQEAENRATHQRLRERMSESGAVAASQVMFDVFRNIEKIGAFSDLPVLITGETGTGKELVARAIYQQDPVRRGKAFLPVNCGALDPELAGSELFGHRKGAFTGAVEQRSGFFRAADQGILFLDEVGELTPTIQARMLRVLQTGRVMSVGDDHEMAVDVRVIAATNRDLPRMIRDGTFREDLYHRLNVTAIHIPPLRNRPQDIAPLVRHFLERYGGVAEQPGADFLYALEHSRLPGNARQLENLVRYALVYRDSSGPITLRDLPPEVLRGLLEEEPAKRIPPKQETAGSDFAAVLEQNGWNLGRSLESIERTLIETALRAAGGNQTKAAQRLGITPRSIYNKLHRR